MSGTLGIDGAGICSAGACRMDVKFEGGALMFPCILLVRVNLSRYTWPLTP